MTFPDRLTPLLKRLEAGEVLSRAELDRLAALQALDVAKVGEDFARSHLAREEARTQEFHQTLEDRKSD